MSSNIAQPLLDWYSKHARKLPWRDNPDPYWVWVSEIMLQQTRVDTVQPYFELWMERFPSIPVLAGSTQQEVLAAWEGLGYYSRARNLHRAAHILVTRYAGELPDDQEELEKLPGIGPYTAAAISSIAFKRDAAALDGNIRRVLARLFDVGEPLKTTQCERILKDLSESSLPIGRAGDYNQALMDLGALICKPHNPDCTNCPLTSECLSFIRGNQNQRPVILPKKSLPHHTAAAAVIEGNSKILLAQRPPSGLLGGMWEFPGGVIPAEENPASSIKQVIKNDLGLGIEVAESFGVYHHAYTHYKVTMHAFLCSQKYGKSIENHSTKILQWVTPDQLGQFPMGKINRQIANKLISRYSS